MLRKLSSVVVGTLLISGIAVAAQSTSTFPSGVDESHPGHTGGQEMPSMKGGRAPAGKAGSTARSVPEPASVDESHPGHTGGQEMPSMKGGRGATSTPGATGRTVPYPASVDESHPGHTGGQSMPSMGR